MQEIISALFSMQDMSYKAFQQALIPTVCPNSVIGVRTPQLRSYAKQIVGTDIAKEFLQELPHQYYEENNLHGFLLEHIADVNACLEALNAFLPYIDNWATCDMLRPKILSKAHTELLPWIKRWLKEDQTYMVRYGIGMLMTHFLDDYFDPQYLELVASVKSDEYYVRMMIAWYFATALAKQYDSAVVYLQSNALPVWVHNKTIQKAVESLRITAEQKRYLRTLRRSKHA